MVQHLQHFPVLRTKKIFTSFNLLQMKNFQINPSVAIEMHQLQTIAQWDVLIPTQDRLCHSHVFIFFLNTRSLSLHKNDFFIRI
jgi:hypothetical protein